MKKYIYLDIEKYMNHKMIFHEYEEIDRSSEEKGVMGIYALSANYDFEKKVKYFKEGGARINGAKASYDNIRCSGQTIKLPDEKYTKIILIGFHETGSYPDTIKLVDAQGIETEKSVMMYHMLENLDMLYECDLDENSRIAYSLETNAMVKMHYYVATIELDKKYQKIILQDNEEAHIAAISLII